jgi:diguanylate cyclase (GGDEF)-like protein
MLYSEIKERENRFITALKIVFPFLLLLGIALYVLQIFRKDPTHLILLILLVPIYVYYTVYLIYNGFQKTLIDPLTKTFNRENILIKMKKMKKREKNVVVFLHVRNLSDINERYGFTNGDIVLKRFIEKLQAFLSERHLKNVPIGRYGNNTFLFFTPISLLEMKHLMTIFTKNIQNVGIDNIELKVNVSLIHANYDPDIDNIIEKLILLAEEKKLNGEKQTEYKPDTLKAIITQAVNQNRLFFKYQPAISVQNHEYIVYEVLTRIESQEHGTFLKHEIQRIVNYTGYEKEFDEKVFERLLNEVKPLLETQSRCLFSIEISPVSLRNPSFKRYLQKLFASKKIDPSRFILEITEKQSYEEMHRFREIIKSYHEMGFKVALGNFGGNNTSVEYFKYLPIDLVKFDIEFTKNIEVPKYEQLLKHYITLCQTLCIQTMVKFVDKEALFEKIDHYKPDFIQGFYISKPKPIEQLQGELL